MCVDGNSPGSELRTTTRVMWEVDGEEGAGLLGLLCCQIHRDTDSQISLSSAATTSH